MKNKLDDLRNHLFATLEALQDDDNPMDVSRAKAVSDVAQTLINTAKIEIQYLEATNQQSGSDFFEGNQRLSPHAPARLVGRQAQ